MTQNVNFIHHLHLSKTEMRLDLISHQYHPDGPGASEDFDGKPQPIQLFGNSDSRLRGKLFCEGRFKMLPWAMRGAERVWAPLAVFTMQTQLLSPGQGGI